MSQKSYRWFTPSDIVDMARVFYKGTIHTDPFSETEANRIVKAKRFYTVEQNGFDPRNPWVGNVFANPPGGKFQGQSRMGMALARAVKEHNNMNSPMTQCILLLKASIGYSWFLPVFLYPHCFLKEKPSFFDAAHPNKA